MWQYLIAKQANCMLRKQLRNYIGGAIYISDNTVLSFNGSSNFINDSGTIGGAIYISGNTVLSFNGSSNFINNEAYYYHGGAIQARNALLHWNQQLQSILLLWWVIASNQL